MIILYVGSMRKSCLSIDRPAFPVTATFAFYVSSNTIAAVRVCVERCSCLWTRNETLLYIVGANNETGFVGTGFVALAASVIRYVLCGTQTSACRCIPIYC